MDVWQQSWRRPHRPGLAAAYSFQSTPGFVRRRQVASVGGGSPASSTFLEDGHEYEQTVLLGWSISALVHGSLLTVVAVFNLHTALTSAIPQKQPFRWDVSLIAAPKDEPMVAQGVQAQSAPEEDAADLQLTDDARPAQQESEYSHPSEESFLPEADVPQVASRPSAPRSPSVSDRSVVSAEQAVKTAPMAVTTPATSLIPPPQVESPQESSSLQVETQLESPMVLQRPQAVTRDLLTRTTFPDYTWLMDVLRRKLEVVKAYPASAKAAHAQGRVVVQVRIQRDGHLVNPEIEESSGYPMLDQAALDALRAASPLRLDHDLEETPVVMLVPLNYQLE